MTMNYYIYWYPVVHPTEEPCFKVGRGDETAKGRIGHSRKLVNDYSGDPTSFAMIAVGLSLQRAHHIETTVHDWLVERGLPLAGFEIRATRAKEKERERRTGRKRQSKEIFRMNGRAWHTIDAMLRQRVEGLL
jgi:hypothetical protein